MLTPLVRIFSLVLTLVLLAWVALLLSAEQDSPGSKSVFQGEDIRLEMRQEEAISLNLYEISNNTGSNKAILGPKKGSIAINASQLTITEGVTNDSISLSLNLKSASSSSSLDLQKLELILNVFVDQRDQKWLVDSASIDYDVNVKNCSQMCQDASVVDVAFVNGATNSKADRYCAKDYTICAPINLCWRCEQQTLMPDLTSVKSPGMTAAVTLNGLRLQPMANNGTKTFGYDWDCEPLLSAGLWQALLVSLFLASILIWALAMVADLKTPVRFDGPNDKPLHVPLND